MLTHVVDISIFKNFDMFRFCIIVSGFMNVAKNYQTFETSTFLPLILAFKNVIFMIFLVLKIERKRNESF